MPKLVIFGTRIIAELACAYFETDSDYDVVAFTVDAPFLDSPTFCDRPVVPFDEVTQHYPPGEFEMFVALSYQQLNGLRKEKYIEAKAKGYAIASYVSSRASILDPHTIGENCFILEDNTLQPHAVIGNNVTLWSGNHIGHHSTIGDHCFVSSHVVVSGSVDVGEQCFLGVNATLRDHISVGAKCVIGAGALILSDAAPEGVYVGKGTERSRVPSSRLPRI